MKKHFWKYVLVAAIVAIAAGFTAQRLYVKKTQGPRNPHGTGLGALEKTPDMNNSDPETLKQLGIAYHGQAVEDPAAFAPKAVEFLTAAHDAKTEDWEALSYLGSATTMLAMTTDDLMEKMTYVNQGIGYMDKAVRRDPDNPTVRLVRANNAMALPDFLNRRHMAVADFEHLAVLFGSHPEMPAALKAEVFSKLVQLYEQSGDAEAARRYAQKAAEAADRAGGTAKGVEER